MVHASHPYKRIVLIKEVSPKFEFEKREGRDI
jgi:hypothetical protein